MKEHNPFHSFFVGNPRDWQRDPLLISIWSVIGLLIIVTLTLYLMLGSGPLLSALPWFNPLGFIFIALASVSLAFLVLGRFVVLHDKFAYWIGIGFATHSITMMFYVLSWPGLLPDGQSLIAQLPNTAGFLVTISPMILALFVLRALLVPEQRLQFRRRRSLLRSMVIWSLLVSVLFALLVVFERSLPVMVRPDGSYTSLLAVWDFISVSIFILDIGLCLRKYRRTGDDLYGFLVFPLAALVFANVAPIFGEQRYDIWWYFARIVLMGGYLVILVCMLSQYVRLFRQVVDGETRYRQLTEGLPQLIWTTTPDGSANYLSPQWVAYTGVPAGQQFGDRWLDQVHTEDRQQASARWKAARERGEVYSTEYRLRRADGVYRWFKAVGLPIRNSEGIISQWFGSCTDIEDQKQAEDSLREYTLQLEHRNRDLQEFAYIASHDLQEPLRKIETFADILLNHKGNEEDVLKRMTRSAARLREMIKGLMQLVHLDYNTFSIESVDLSEIANGVIADLELQIRRCGGIVEVEPLPVIQANPAQMYSLFQNLISNGLKFQPEDGTPVVKVCAEAKDNNQAMLFVEDNGIGFDVEHAGHLFEPFKRLVGKNKYEGSGIGLAICRKIVELHHGEISVRSQVGRGTTFVVTLPIQQDETLQVRS